MSIRGKYPSTAGAAGGRRTSRDRRDALLLPAGPASAGDGPFGGQEHQSRRSTACSTRAQSLRTGRIDFAEVVETPERDVALLQRGQGDDGRLARPADRSTRRSRADEWTAPRSSGRRVQGDRGTDRLGGSRWRQARWCLDRPASMTCTGAGLRANTRGDCGPCACVRSTRMSMPVLADQFGHLLIGEAQRFRQTSASRAIAQ